MGDAMTELFWTTCIISDKTGVWRCSNSDAFLSLKQAVEEIEYKREHYPQVVCGFVEKTVGGGLPVPMYVRTYI